LTTRLHVDDATLAVVAALDRPSLVAGEVFNIGETVALSVRAWIELILSVAGADAELVSVPDRALPADLRLTRAHAQHLVASNRKAMTLLDWQPQDSVISVGRSVRWHLDHPPTQTDTDFSADDDALAQSA
jgi:nucleoside-diphosphate-sugar epimerase